MKFPWAVAVMTSSKVIDKNQLSAFERWELPHVNDEGKPGRMTTASQLEGIQSQAFEEGFAAGHQQGFEQGLSEGQETIRQHGLQLEQLLQALERPFEELDEQVIEQTALLATAIAKQLIRRELKTDPGQVVAVVREAISALPVSARNIQVYLHPDDAALVRDALSLATEQEDGMQVWKIVEEPLISRGGCRITAENSTIDATLEKRLNRIITSLLGGERADDASHAED